MTHSKFNNFFLIIKYTKVKKLKIYEPHTKNEKGIN